MRGRVRRWCCVVVVGAIARPRNKAALQHQERPGDCEKEWGCRRRDGVEGKMDTTNVVPVELCHVTIVEPVEISFFSEREHEDATKPRRVGI